MKTATRALSIMAAAILIGSVHASIADWALPPRSSTDAARTAGDGMSLETVRRKYDDPTVVFVDASRPDEFAAGHIPGAVNIPLRAFVGGRVPDAVDYFDREASIVVYCPTERCDAARRVADFLEALGYSRVEVFHPGFKAWRDAGLPVER